MLYIKGLETAAMTSISRAEWHCHYRYICIRGDLAGCLGQCTYEDLPYVTRLLYI